jgi:hypothetical protein
LYFKYEVRFPCVDLTGAKRSDIRLVLTGSGTLLTEPLELVDVRTGEEVLSFVYPDGTVDQSRNIYLSAEMFLGHRTVRHEVRHPLGRSSDDGKFHLPAA